MIMTKKIKMSKILREKEEIYEDLEKISNYFHEYAKED